VLCIIITDRKWKGRIVRKHEFVAAIVDRLGLELFAHKILVRTQKVDLYRLGFSHVQCFRRQTLSHKRTAASDSTEFRRDLWGPFEKFKNLPVTRNSFAPQAIRMLVEAFTNQGDLILDPFCGTGITQRVALGLGRQTKGYEIDRKLKPFWRELAADTPRN
jgi:tRNA G10  N-methylase Trm11